MFDLVVEEHSDRSLLIHMLKGLKAMALKVDALDAAIAANSAAVARNTTAVDALIASHADPAGQAAVDAAAVALGSNTSVLDAESAKAEAAVAPVTVAAA